MNLRAIQEKLFEETLTAYLKRANPSIDLSLVIRPLLDGDGVDNILKAHSKLLTFKNLNALKTSLLAEELNLILKEQQQTISLLDSPRFKDLERMFEASVQNKFLLKFFIKLVKGQQNQMELIEYYSSVDPSEQSICQKVLSSDEFSMWAKPGSRISQGSISDPKGSSQATLGLEIKDSKQLNLKEKKLLQVRQELAKLLSSFSQHTESLVDLVINQEPKDRILEQFQDKFFADQYGELLEILQSPIFAEIKKKLEDIHNEPKQNKILEESRKQLGLIFGRFKFNVSPIIQAILSQSSEQDVLNQLAEELFADQYQNLLDIINSAELKNIKDKIKNGGNIVDSKAQNLQKKKEELAILVKDINGFSIKLIDAIVGDNEEEIKATLKEISSKMKVPQFKKLSQFLTSETMVNFRKNLKKQIIDEREQMKKQLRLIFKDIPHDLTVLIEAIISGKSEEPILKQLEENMTVFQLQQLTQMLNHEPIIAIRAKIAQQMEKQKQIELIDEKKKQLFKLFSGFPIDLKDLVDKMVNKESLDQHLKDLSGKMRAKDYNKMVEIIKKQDQKSQPQEENFSLKIKKELALLFKDCNQSVTQKLIEAISKGDEEDKILGEISLKLIARQYIAIQKIAKSQEALNIKKKINKQKTKEELIDLLKQLNVRSRDLVDAIICGDSEKEKRQIELLSQKMNGKDYNCLVGFLESQKMSLIRSIFNKKIEVNKQSEKDAKKRNQLEKIFSPFKAYSSKLVEAIMKKQPEQEMLKQVSQSMNGKEYTSLIQILNSKEFLEIKDQIKQTGIDETDIRRKELINQFSQFQQQAIHLADSVLSGKQEKQILQQFSKILNGAQFMTLQTYLNSKQFAQLKKRHKISSNKNSPFQEELATFLNPLPSRFLDIYSLILDGKVKEQGQFIADISRNLPEVEFQQVKKIIFSPKFLKFRTEKLKSFGQVSSQASDYYQKFSKIMNLIYKQGKQFTAELNSYLLALRLLRKQPINNILKGLEDLLHSNAFTIFEDILNSLQLYTILEGFEQENDHDKIAINYHFRQLKDSENIVKMILEGKQDNQFNDFVTNTKKNRSVSFIKKIDEILSKEQVRILKIRLVKKRQLCKIFTKDEDKILINALISLQKDKVFESLKQIRQFIGIERYENYSYRLFTGQVEAITETKLINSPNTSQILLYFHSKKIQVSCVGFIDEILASNDISSILNKYKTQFSERVYTKLQQQIASKPFMMLLYNKRYPNFEVALNEVTNLFSFLKLNDRLAQAILFNCKLQQQIEQILMSEALQSLESLYEVLKNKVLQELLEKVSLKLPQIEQQFIVQKKEKRYLYKRGTKLLDIKLDKNFHFSNDQMFINHKCQVLQDEYVLNEHILCTQGAQYDIEFLTTESTVLLPHKQSVEKIKKVLQSKLDITNELCIQINKNNEYVPLQDKSLLRKCGTTQLRVNYFINLIIKVQLRQADENIKIISSQPIAKIQIRIEDQINMKKENQKWYLDGQELLDTANVTFQKLKIRENFVRIKIIEDRSLEYYGFDKIIPIERNQFKSFYIEDDEQTKSLVKSSDFPSYAWSEAFRNISLGYIFSGMKKHSRIQSCLKHIQNIVEKAGKDDKLWKPKTFEEKRYFNEIYVIYNIIKSSKTELRTDIFKCLMTHYPIPLVIFNENGQTIKLFQENYWLMNKAFTIVSFGLTSQKIEDKFEEIHGKSTLLNITFETDFQDKANLHRVCEGGISIQYNLYQSDEYFVNLIDISNKIQENLIIKLAKASNLVIVHAKKQDETYVQEWLKEKGLNLPVVIFTRDVKNIFNQDKKIERKRQRQANEQNKYLKKYSLVEISQKSLNYFNVQFNQIANSVQVFTRQCYLREKEENFWNFSDFLGESCNKSYLDFNNTLKKLEKTSEDLSRITNYFYQWKILSYKKDIATEKENSIKMEQIKEKAKQEGIAQLLKTILEFYQNNSSRATEIMSKLRMFLTLIRNELFRDFNELYKLLQNVPEKQDESEFKKYKDFIVIRLENINKLQSNLTTPKITESINEFFTIQDKYKISKDIDDIWKKIFKDISNQFENYIQPKTFSIENFWREVIYMSKFDPKYTFKSNDQHVDLHETIVSLCKKQINQSENFEIINGDLLEMPSEFLKKVFENQQNKKIMIVAIFGPQSSGKSTLLNFVLGCDFMSSAGRCTKGIYGTYFEISNKQIPNCEAILVLDTQGLFSNYKNEKFENRNGFDNKLVLFCLQVCDLIIMNTKGDMTKECQQILANAFDSEAIDSKNLPTVYFVLNCNGGPANITQTKQVQNACMEIIKLNPVAESVASPSNLKGMPMAFNEIPRKTNAAEISKYMATKKIPSDVFYKETNILSGEIFRVLGDRGRARRGRTLNQAFDDMGLTWATINRFSILTVHGNRKIKELQQNIQQWIKLQSEKLQSIALQSKKKLSIISYKRLNEWSKIELNTYKKIIDDLRDNFQVQFPVKQGDNVKAYNRCIERALDDLDSLFDPTVEDLKRSVLERKYRLEMEQSQKNGLDDIITLVKHIKCQQLMNNTEIDEDDKKKRFEELWSQRIVDMRQGLNRKKMAGQHYKNMEQLYNAALKASDPSKTIYKIEQSKGIIELNDKEFNTFDKYLISQVMKKYREQTIFHSSNEKPIMNIEKQTGDLSFKYLDMSKYFEKKVQKVYLSIRAQDIVGALSVSYIKNTINEKVKSLNSGATYVESLHHDFVHLLGLSVKKSKLQEWVNYYLSKKWFHFDIFSSPSELTFPRDLQRTYKTKENTARYVHGVKYYEQVHQYYIEKHKDYFFHKHQYNDRTKFFKDFKILHYIPDFVNQIAEIIRKQPCKNSQDGNNCILNKIFKKILDAIAVQNDVQQTSQCRSKQEIQRSIGKIIVEDLQKLNLIVLNPNDLVRNISNKHIKATQIVPIKISLAQFKSEEQLKRIISDFGPFWNKDILLKSYSKGSYNDSLYGVLTFGFIDESRINVKKDYLSQKILQTYIGKQYQQFLNQIQKSNFKNFIERQLKYESCFQEIRSFIFSKKLEQADINFSIMSLKNKVNEILGLINKDLQQVSQRLRFDFVIELHSYAFHLLWLVSLNEEWKNRENLINEFNEKKEKQYLRFLGLSSGKADQENKATSKTFVEDYMLFLNDKITQAKRTKSMDLANFYNAKYTRERIQEQVEARLTKETDEQVIKNYLLKPQEYIEKVLQDEVRNSYLIDMEKYSKIDYWMIVKQLATLTTEICMSTLPDVKQCSIEEVFDINILDESKNKAFIELYCQIILKSRKDYVSSQQKLGQFVIKEGRRFKINNSCTFKENVEFLNFIQTKQIVITNIRLFCEFLKDQLLKIIGSKELKLEISKQDKVQAMKNLKIDICKHKCPVCKKGCDIDMFVSPHHSVHKCNSGHQIRAIGGMAVEQTVQNKVVYTASILRCNDMTPDSKFQFNGAPYKWSQFKLQYQNQWDFQANAQQANNKKIYEKLWKNVGQKICDHYGTAQKAIKYVEYSEQTVKKQTASIEVMKPAHYIFAIDESGSMGGDKWTRALDSLKDTIQIVSNINKDKNQLISLFKFNDNVKEVFTDSTPDNFNKNAVVFSGGGTTFGPAFAAAIKMMKNHKDKNNIFVFISDGEAEYPDAQIKQIATFSQEQLKKSLSVGYTSILIASSKNASAPIMERITKDLKGQHNLVIDASQISVLLKEIHFKG